MESLSSIQLDRAEQLLIESGQLLTRHRDIAAEMKAVGLDTETMDHLLALLSDDAGIKQRRLQHLATKMTEVEIAGEP